MQLYFRSVQKKVAFENIFFVNRYFLFLLDVQCVSGNVSFELVKVYPVFKQCFYLPFVNPLSFTGIFVSIGCTICFQKMLHITWLFNFHTTPIKFELLLCKSRLSRSRLFSDRQHDWKFAALCIHCEEIWPLSDQIRSNLSFCDTRVQLYNYRVEKVANDINVINITIENLLLVK